MSLDPSSGVPDETSYELLDDSVNLIASTTINGVAYGIMLTFYGICVYYTLYKTPPANKRRALWYLAYMTAMSILGTLYTASNARTIQLAYVNHRLFSAGPAVYDEVIYSEPITILGSASDVLLGIMTSAILLWRFIILYQGCSFFYLVIAFPCLLLLAVIVIGLISLVQASLPNQSLWSSAAVSFAVPYFILSISFAVITNVLMVGRLQLHRRRFERALGRDHGSPYTTISAILIESATLYAVWSLIFLVLYVINHPVQYVFMASLSQVQIIAPLLITLRVSQGKAWTGNTAPTILSTFRVPTTFPGSDSTDDDDVCQTAGSRLTLGTGGTTTTTRLEKFSASRLVPMDSDDVGLGPRAV